MKTNAEILTAHCSPEIAAWLDPTGKLREAGLMKVDLKVDFALCDKNQTRDDIRQGRNEI